MIRRLLPAALYAATFLLVAAATFTGILQNYMLFSFLAAIGICAGFFLSFEARRPSLRDIMPLVVICVLASLGRVVFSFLPQIQPVTVLVICAGFCFGKQSGFLSGALCAFLSNLFLGQGPWTPWQMLAWGLVGFLAGCFPQNTARWLLLLYAFFSGILYGLVVDIWTLSSLGVTLSWETAASVYLAAGPFNLLHAGGNVVFFLLLFKPISKQLLRMKTKYGIAQDI